MNHTFMHSSLAPVLSTMSQSSKRKSTNAMEQPDTPKKSKQDKFVEELRNAQWEFDAAQEKLGNLKGNSVHGLFCSPEVIESDSDAWCIEYGMCTLLKKVGPFEADSVIYRIRLCYGDEIIQFQETEDSGELVADMNMGVDSSNWTFN